MTMIIPIPAELGAGIAPAYRRETTTAELEQLAEHLWLAAEVLSGGVLAVPEFEAKAVIGWHLYLITDAVRSVEDRLREVGSGRRGRPRGGRTLHTDITAAQVFHLAYALHLHRAVHIAQHLLAADGGLADAPSRRVVALHLTELTGAATWGADVLSRQTEAMTEGERGTFARWALSPKISEEQEVGRPRTAVRDDRFRQFSHTRDYRKDEDASPDAGTRYRADLLELARVNRDEIDAIETFCLVYHDLLDEVPAEMLHDLARTAWDESRHALLGNHVIEHMGLDPYDYPCSMIGIIVRSNLGGWDALSQISLFGELNIIAPMRRLAQTAAEQGDPVSAGVFDHICSDEVLHLKRFRRWLRELHPLGDLAAIERETQRRAGRELDRAGVMGEEYFVKLSSREVFELLGE